MFKLFKIITMLVLITALNGQALAIASMSCQMADMHSHQSSVTESDQMAHSMDSMDHSMHDMQDMATEMDCCKTQCVCPTSGCSQAVYLSLSAIDTSSAGINSQVVPIESYFKGLITFSAFKPPIIA